MQKMREKKGISKKNAIVHAKMRLDSSKVSNNIIIVIILIVRMPALNVFIHF